MTIDERYQKRYETGDTPWDIGRADFNLVQTVTTMAVTPPAKHWIWDAEPETTPSGSLKPVSKQRALTPRKPRSKKAVAKAEKIQAPCRFMVAHLLADRIEGALFGFAFDRGCFHSFNSEEERRQFAEKVAACLEADGRWLSILGNADEQRPAPGPPRRTAGEIVRAVEPCFEILSLVSGRFDSNRQNPPRAWVCLMRKRERPLS